MYSHKSSSHSVFSIRQTDGKRWIDLESAESCPTKSHHISEPISAVEQCFQAHIQHLMCEGSSCSKAADDIHNRNHGILLSWMMLPDLATVSPSYGTVEQAAPARCEVASSWSLFSVLRCLTPGCPACARWSWWWIWWSTCGTSAYR